MMKKLISTTLIALGLCATFPTAPAQAGSEPYVGEISWFAGNFAPRGWAFCDGQLLAVSQNDALFSLLGTIYGGDGRTTFGLPDLRGRVPMHAGTGPGLSPRRLGAKFGSEFVTLTQANLPNHSHTGALKASTAAPDVASPNGAALAGADLYASRGSIDATLAGGTVTLGNTGGNQQMPNMQPWLGVRCIVALVGIYPSRQ
jgi:microcystin-dependent protein